MTSRQPVTGLGLSHHNSNLQSNTGRTCLCLTFLSTTMLAPVRLAGLQGFPGVLQECNCKRLSGIPAVILSQGCTATGFSARLLGAKVQHCKVQVSWSASPSFEVHFVHMASRLRHRKQTEALTLAPTWAWRIAGVCGKDP